QVHDALPDGVGTFDGPPRLVAGDRYGVPIPAARFDGIRYSRTSYFRFRDIYIGRPSRAHRKPARRPALRISLSTRTAFKRHSQPPLHSPPPLGHPPHPLQIHHSLVHNV